MKMQNTFSMEPSPKFSSSNRSRLFLLLISGLFLLGGCGQTQTPKDETEPAEEVVYAPEPIRMLIVGDELIGPRIVRQWKARRDGVVELTNCSVESFIASGLEIEQGVDVVIYPSSLLGELAEKKKIVEVPKSIWSSDSFNRNELLKHFRQSIVRYANEPWAVPLGGANFVMLCDGDQFEIAGVEPPETWEQVESRLEKLGAEGEPVKIDLPLTKGWAANSFLARVAPTIRHRGALSSVFERKTMKPLIAKKPFAESLEQLKRVASKRSLELDPKRVFQLAANGESVIAFAWPSNGFSDQKNDDGEEETEQQENNSLLIRPLPGVKRWFDYDANVWNKRNDENEIHVDLVGFRGLVASVPSTASDPDTAWEFLEWLPSKSISLITLVDSPNIGPFRASHLGDVGRWTGNRLSLDVLDQYADVVSENHSRPLVLMFPRIPGRQEYFDTLDEAVRSYLSSDRSADEVLEEVAIQWEAITERLGRIQQVKALRRESGT